MAYDTIIDKAQLEGAITASANAIREKTGDTALIEWLADKGFADAIAAIEAGSGEDSLLGHRAIKGSFTPAENILSEDYSLDIPFTDFVELLPMGIYTSQVAFLLWSEFNDNAGGVVYAAKFPLNKGYTLDHYITLYRSASGTVGSSSDYSFSYNLKGNWEGKPVVTVSFNDSGNTSKLAFCSGITYTYLCTILTDELKV